MNAKNISLLPGKADLSKIPSREEPRKVLLCPPDFYNIQTAENVYMKNHIGKVDKKKSHRQWESLFSHYLQLKYRKIIDDVLVIPAADELQDMVFCANQTFPWVTSEKEKIVLMSNMKSASRQKEVPYFENFFTTSGYKAVYLKSKKCWEGMGDTIPHPFKMLLYGGYGHRSEPITFDEISKMLNLPILTLRLVNEKYYHLDTCFLPLDENTVFICKEAFDEEGIKTITHNFSNVIFIPDNEAEKYFSLNAHCINDKKTNSRIAVIQEGCKLTIKHLEKYGYEILETDTSEFMKSGGSVFCMKMMVY